jgi:hypothetical protein
MIDHPKYGAFESHPARFTDTEAWVYQHDNIWRKMNSAEVTQHAAVLSEANYRAAYPDLPALPTTAFTTPSSATTPPNKSFGFREARPDEYGQSYVIGGQRVPPLPTPSKKDND